jgi:hypothetical protein
MDPEARGQLTMKTTLLSLGATLLAIACATGPAADRRSEPADIGAPSPGAAQTTAPSALAQAPANPDATGVLFIGNSLTFYNDLPRLFVALAESGGRSVEADMSSSGGGTLAGHATSGNTRYKLNQRTWSFVVLQEQSEYPAVAARRQELVYPALRALRDRIAEVGAVPILFMTWGRRDGCPEIGYQTYEEMQAGVEEGYLEIADEYGWAVVPVGVAWRNAIEQRPDLELWLPDGIHPTLPGSYLAACTFYAAIFRHSPVGLGFLAGLPEEEARFLQGIAAATVMGDPRRWHISSD